MASTYATPESDIAEMEAAPQLLPPELRTFMYLVHGPNVLGPAVKVDPMRVAQIFASQNPPPSESSPQVPITVAPSTTTSYLRISPPSITPYDGHPSNLRAFCSQLVNQIQGSEKQFPTEMDKVRFAYQCLGAGALTKMRSSFRCLEDPTINPEIVTLDEFISALKQRCQDPCLTENATRTIDNLCQDSMRFHDFITIFEDNMTDSTYGHLGKENWKVMLERRLSRRLRNALVMAQGVPNNYHEFVSYLRKKDAAFHEINASDKYRAPKPPLHRTTFPLNNSFPSITPDPRNLPVSQGGSAMDLDNISEEKGPDGRLTMEAKEARRKLGHCLRCNKPGHFARECPLGKKTLSSVTALEASGSELDQLKEQLQ